MTRPRAIVSQIPVTDLKTQAEAVAFSIAWPGREVEPAAGPRPVITMAGGTQGLPKISF